MDNNVGSLIRKLEQDYVTGTVTISEHVEFSQYDNINRIEAYLNSRFTEGSYDALNREKPFFNIVTGATNIWYRATDIDRKNIRIKATKQQDFIASFLASVILQDYMRRENIGVFLNDWGRTLARYGSAVTKFVEKGDRLHTVNVSWNKLICDPIDFYANPKIEILELTPAQLRQREGYDKEVVEALLKARSERELLNKRKKDNRADYIKLYEIHGELPKSFLTDKEEDKDKYVQQMQVVSFVAGKEKGEFDDFVLIKGKEEVDPYMISHLIKEEGRTQSIGAVEHLFEAQWMQNYTVKSIKDQLDLASKIIFQSSDGRFQGRNVLTDIENGRILTHAVNQPLTAVNNTAHDYTALQAFSNMWRGQAQESTSTTDAISGNTMPSGTAYRQVAILNQESHSLFELMTENKGLAIEEMMRKHIIPFIKRKLLNNTKEISAILEAHDIKKIDSRYIKNTAIRRANSKIKEMVMGGAVLSPMQQQDIIGQEEASVQESLAEMGNQRFFKPSEISSKTWKQALKDLEWEVDVEVTNENTDKEVVFETLNTVLQTIAANPMVLQDPNAKMLFNKILEETGRVSPVEISPSKAVPQAAV